MTTLTILKSVIELFAVLAICLGLYHEKELIRFERRLARFVRCFFKALAVYHKEKSAARRGSVVVDLNVGDEQNERAPSDNKAKVIDFRIA